MTLPAFEIGRYPVTNAEYAAFVEATGHDAPRHWRDGRLPEELADHPVVYVTWHDAQAYVTWLRGADRPALPPAHRGRVGEGGPRRRRPPLALGQRLGPGAGPTASRPARAATTPVGQYSPAGDSPYGCADMAGNVWEWCSSQYRDYPYRADDGRENLEER